MSTTASQVTGGGKAQDENKKPFENMFPEKERLLLEHSSIISPQKYDHNKINNSATQQP